jgi:hypothetical protein
VAHVDHRGRSVPTWNAFGGFLRVSLAWAALAIVFAAIGPIGMSCVCLTFAAVLYFLGCWTDYTEAKSEAGTREAIRRRRGER